MVCGGLESEISGGELIEKIQKSLVFPIWYILVLRQIEGEMPLPEYDSLIEKC